MVVFTDGASRGNPGDAAIGVVITREDGTIVKEVSQAIGTATNNAAEYKALIVGLREASALGAEHVEVRTDSELMVRQLNGIYQVKSSSLQPLFEEAVKLLHGFQRWSATHICREENRRADELAGLAARQAAKSRKC